MKGAIHSKALREAARRVEENMLKAWDAEDGSGHVFSPSFDLRMEPLLTSARRRERRRRTAQTLAAAFAAVLLCAFTWLASNAAARHAVQKWIRETWRNTVVYRFTDTREAALPKYRPTWLPEGYKEAKVFETGLYCTVTYQNDQGDCFFFSYLLMKDGSNMGLVFHSGEEYRHEAVLIDGNPGELYVSLYPLIRTMSTLREQYKTPKEQYKSALFLREKTSQMRRGSYCDAVDKEKGNARSPALVYASFCIARILSDCSF